MNILPGNLRFGAGQPVKRLEDQRLLTGKGQFIDDKPEDGALWLLCAALAACACENHVDRYQAPPARCRASKPFFTGADLIADDIGTIPTLVDLQAA